MQRLPHLPQRGGWSTPLLLIALAVAIAFLCLILAGRPTSVGGTALFAVAGLSPALLGVVLRTGRRR